MAIPLRDQVPTRGTPWVTIALLVVNVVVFLFVQPSAFQNPPDREDRFMEAFERTGEAIRFTYRWGVVPCEVLSGERLVDRPDTCHEPESGPFYSSRDKSVWLALLTAMFLHGSTLHLVGNMLFLWVFGNNVEERFGPLLFLAVYLVGGALASLGYVAVHPHASIPLLGASGAIAVAMGAYLLIHPRGRILAAVLSGTVQLVYLPAAVLLVLFFVTQFFTPDNEVAWEAHAAGMVVGFLAALALQFLPSVRRRAGAHEEDSGLRTWEAF